MTLNFVYKIKKSISLDLHAFEIKSSSTYQPHFLTKLEKIKKIYPKIKTTGLIYNGLSKSLSQNLELINFKDIEKLINF